MLIACVPNALLAQFRLSEPFPVMVGDEVLDIKLDGGSAPCLVDFDGDGLRDLVIGQAASTNVRLYRNVGNSRLPEFNDYEIILHGLTDGQDLPVFGCSPRVADLNGDGLWDIVTNSHFSFLGFLQQSEPASFSKFEELCVLRSLQSGVLGFDIADWNNDGALDILVGIQNSYGQQAGPHVYWVPGSKKPSERFGKLEPIIAGGETIRFNSGCAYPCAADWDNDGLLDLVIGARDGSIWFFRNAGTREEPKLERGKQLAPFAGPNGERGQGGQVCVADWNLDGKLDLIVGESGKAFENRPTPGELEKQAAFREKQEAAFGNWSKLFRAYRLSLEKFREPEKNGDDSLPNGSSEKALDALTKQLAIANLQQLKYSERAAAIREGPQLHGRVWVFLQE